MCLVLGITEASSRSGGTEEGRRGNVALAVGGEGEGKSAGSVEVVFCLGVGVHESGYSFVDGVVEGGLGSRHHARNVCECGNGCGLLCVDQDLGQ